MKRLSHAKSRDANEPAIVNALRAVGASVIRLDNPVDLLVGYHGKTRLLEVKRPLGPRGGKNGTDLTPDQENFLASWTGGAVAIVRSIDEALEAVRT